MYVYTGTPSARSLASCLVPSQSVAAAFDVAALDFYAGDLSRGDQGVERFIEVLS